MNTIIERILLSPGECFRLIRWRASNAKIEIISANGTSVRAQGEGHHWHHHPETEITLFRSGAATRFIGDHIVRFSAPDLVLIGGNVPHYWHSAGLTSGVSVQCNFDDMNPVWSLPYFAGLPALRRLADRGVRIRGRTGELVQQAMGNLEKARGIERLSCFFQVLADLLAAPRADMQILSTRSYSLHGVAGNVVGIRKALHLAFARFREEVHLDDALKVNGMAKATFCRQFKKHVGQSYTDFLNHFVCKLRVTTWPRRTSLLSKWHSRVALASWPFFIDTFGARWAAALRLSGLPSSPAPSEGPGRLAWQLRARQAPVEGAKEGCAALAQRWDAGRRGRIFHNRQA